MREKAHGELIFKEEHKLYPLPRRGRIKSEWMSMMTVDVNEMPTAIMPRQSRVVPLDHAETVAWGTCFRGIAAKRSNRLPLECVATGRGAFAWSGLRKDCLVYLTPTKSDQV
jgi:hypothetical protein